MDKLKNPDIAAAAAMLMALVLELALYLAGDESLLGQLPPALGPVVLTVAAIARWKMGHPSPSTAVEPKAEKVTAPVPEDPYRRSPAEKPE